MYSAFVVVVVVLFVFLAKEKVALTKIALETVLAKNTIHSIREHTHTHTHTHTLTHTHTHSHTHTLTPPLQ